MSLDAGHSPQRVPRTRDEILSRLDGCARSLYEAALEARCMNESDLIALIDRCMDRECQEHPLYDLMLVAFIRGGMLSAETVAKYMAKEEFITASEKAQCLRQIFVQNVVEPVRDSPTNFPQIPGFHFLKKLGKGGQGEVYLAEHNQGLLKGRKVAVKIFKDPTGQHFVRMKKEVNAPEKLPNSIRGKIVSVHDAQPCEGGYYSVMEYVEGGEILGEVEKGLRPPLDAEQVWDIAQNLLETLQAFEEAGMAHRDIKPANILVSGSTVKVADYGLVKTEGHDESFATEDGTILGTAAYLDPDNAKDARFDVYSLGMTVRCLLTGKPPFAEEKREASRLIHAHRSFSQKMGDYSASRKNGGWSKSTSASSPEWVPQLKEPQTPWEKALAYLTERASLPVEKRPMPSALLAELGERFPDLMGDMKSRKRVDSIRQRSRTRMQKVVAGLAVTAAAAGALTLAVMNMGKEGSKEKAPGKGGVGMVVEPPVKQEKKFEGMTTEEKQKLIDEIAVNAVGAPVPVDDVRFMLRGLKSNDNEVESIIGKSDINDKEHVDVVKKLKIGDETVIVGLSLLNQNSNDLSEILEQFRKQGISIENEERTEEELKKSGVFDSLPEDRKKKATAYQKPNDRLLYYIRRGDNIVVFLGYSFVGFHMEKQDGNVSAIYPWQRSGSGFPASKQLDGMLNGLVAPKKMIQPEDFPPESRMQDYKGADVNMPLGAVWKILGGKFEGE